ncbi:hypothetical protein [Streptomyces griseoluteus]|uniref:hypothetical protein n=1 Tax=Streptomyces griseoluteus TaxID=29306 RepID=UPI0036AA2F99
MRGGWHTARARRRLGLGACGAALAALAAVLRYWWLDAVVAGVLSSAIGVFRAGVRGSDPFSPL